MRRPILLVLIKIPTITPLTQEFEFDVILSKLIILKCNNEFFIKKDYE